MANPNSFSGNRFARGGGRSTGHGGPPGGKPAGHAGPEPHPLRVGAPDYIAGYSRFFKDCPPGHAFRLYFAGWEEDWKLSQTKKREVLEQTAELAPAVAKQIESLVSRQQKLAQGQEFLVFSCVTTSPFTTGLGNEHPLENGFAFLDPYGIPYLPGSGVKGAVRRAAEELALFEPDACGWSVPAVWWLFGFDAQAAYFRDPEGNHPPVIAQEIRRWRDAYLKHTTNWSEQAELLFNKFCQLVATKASSSESIREALLSTDKLGHVRAKANLIHLRGALTFLDVIPRCRERLRVDIMNPHYTQYYQEQQAPGDWGMPVPIFFLTLPVGTEFNFVTRFVPPPCWPEEVRDASQAPVDGEPWWKHLLKAAFSFAWEWQGFGAKTSIGYGRMELNKRS
ncbi:MAG: hypothetical protein KatS3mg007_1505 [Thermoanaerobaculum sp.]|nr:MAG: hypothetical protein KatS3mg007_1505 [Thermoanaerobaculum sp.]